MQTGKVSATGPHAEMMENNVKYREFWMKQEFAIDS